MIIQSGILYRVYQLFYRSIHFLLYVWAYSMSVILERRSDELALLLSSFLTAARTHTYTHAGLMTISPGEPGLAVMYQYHHFLCTQERRQRWRKRSGGKVHSWGVFVAICHCYAVNDRRPTSSNPALLQSWTVVCPSFTLLMMLLLPGWPTMGLNRIRKKKKWYLMIHRFTYFP